MQEQQRILAITRYFMCLVIAIFINKKYSIAQYNLIPNPSFEQYSKCPNSFFDPQPTNWYCPTNYYLGYLNICSTSPNWGVPHNGGIPNYQYPHSGNGYIGIFLFNGIGLEQRNYYQIKLKDSLKKGYCYYTEFYVAFEDNVRFGCNNVSALLTSNPVYVDTINFPYGVLSANAQIYNYGNPVMKDTQNWVKVSSVYVALGGEQYLTLGNFKDDTHTNLAIIVPGAYDAAGVMFDDILLTPIDSMPLQADAGKDTTIKVGDSVFIGCLTNGISNIVWRDASNNIINTVEPGFYVKPDSNTFYVVEQTVCGNYSRDTVYITVQPLPLKFMSYALRQAQGNKVENVWTTANEVSVSHYNILRSIDGKDFTTIGKAKAKNKNYNEYQFTDDLKTKDQEPKTLYYRIVGVDNDGKLSYSEVKKLSTINYKPSTINIYPNPTKGLVHILIPSDEKAIWTITVQDVLGKVMSTTQTTALTKSMDMQVSNQRGMYFITLTNNKTGKRMVEKVVVE